MNFGAETHLCGHFVFLMAILTLLVWAFCCPPTSFLALYGQPWSCKYMLVDAIRVCLR